MKKEIVGIFVCMLVCATALPAVGIVNKNIETSEAPFFPPGVEWEYTYGGDEFDWIYCIETTSDGGYIATGLTEEDDMYYAWLLKVDKNGVEEWSKVNYEFNGSSIENDIIVQCVRETPDHGYIVGGLGSFYSTMYGVWTAAGYLWKVDSLGQTDWLMPLGNETEMWYLVPFIFENFDGTGWIITGFYLGITSPTDYYLDVALFKTDFNGNLLWYQHYDLGYDWEFARSLCNTNDGGYFLSGTTALNPSSNIGGFFMIKTNSDGTIDSYKIFDAPGYEYSAATGCLQTSDNGFIMSGLTSSYGAGGTDLWVIKTDADFNEQWNKTFGGPNNDRNYGMDATDDGGYVFVVIKNASYPGGTRDDTWIINTNSLGNIEWELLIEEEGTQWSQTIIQTDDGGFIVAGRTGSMTNPLSDGLILKIAPFPHLDIKIKGGLGIKAIVTNSGLGDAIDTAYKCTITGGILGLINQTINGTIKILAGSQISFYGLYLRFGEVSISVKVGFKEKTATAFLVGPLVLGVKET